MGLIFCENAYQGNWMLVDGKRSGITLPDFQLIGERFSMPKQKVASIVEHVCAATANWSGYADKYGVMPGYAGAIGKELNQLRIR